MMRSMVRRPFLLTVDHDANGPGAIATVQLCCRLQQSRCAAPHRSHHSDALPSGLHFREQTCLSAPSANGSRSVDLQERIGRHGGKRDTAGSGFGVCRRKSAQTRGTEKDETIQPAFRIHGKNRFGGNPFLDHADLDFSHKNPELDYKRHVLPLHKSCPFTTGFST